MCSIRVKSFLILGLTTVDQADYQVGNNPFKSTNVSVMSQKRERPARVHWAWTRRCVPAGLTGTGNQNVETRKKFFLIRHGEFPSWPLSLIVLKYPSQSTYNVPTH